MNTLHPPQHAFRLAGFFPLAGGEFVGFRHGGVDVDGAKDLVQTQTVFHGQYILGDQLAGMLADNGDTENPVATFGGDHFHVAFVSTVGNGSVQIVNAITGNLVVDTLLIRFLFVDPHPGHLREVKVHQGMTR